MSPLRRYALIELAIGVLGLVTLAAIPLLGGAYTALAGGGALTLALRLVVAALALLPATMLMGATLPVVAPWLRGDARGAAWLGWCYAANTAGGVLGSLVAGFYLAARARRLRRDVGRRRVERRHRGGRARRSRAAHDAAARGRRRAPRPRRRERARSTPIYVATALSGMTALAAEVLWTRHLSLLLGGTVYTFALILAVLLLGLGLGSAAGAAAAEAFDPRTALASCQALLGITMAAAAYTVARSLPYWPIDVTLPTTGGRRVAARPAAREHTSCCRRRCSGARAFRWRSRPRLRAGEEPRRAVGPALRREHGRRHRRRARDDVRARRRVGSQRTQQLLIARERCRRAVLLLVRTRGAKARGALSAPPASRQRSRWPRSTVPALPPELIAYGRFLPTRGFDANVVYVGEGLTASIAVTAEPDGTLTYHNAGKTQASTYPQDMRLQRMLGHLTTLVPEQPRNVLVIGLGAGITAGAVSLDPAVERVVVAELEPLVPDVAAEFFDEHNFDVVDERQGRDSHRRRPASARDDGGALRRDHVRPARSVGQGRGRALHARVLAALQAAAQRRRRRDRVRAALRNHRGRRAQRARDVPRRVSRTRAVFANTVEGMGYDAVLVGRNGDDPIDLDAPRTAPRRRGLRARRRVAARRRVRLGARPHEHVTPRTLNRWRRGSKAPRSTPTATCGSSTSPVRG